MKTYLQSYSKGTITVSASDGAHLGKFKDDPRDGTVDEPLTAAEKARQAIEAHR